MVTGIITAAVAAVVLIIAACCVLFLYRKKHRNGDRTSECRGKISRGRRGREEETFFAEVEKAISEELALWDSNDFVDPVDTAAFECKWRDLYEKSREKLGKRKFFGKKRRSYNRLKEFVSAYSKIRKVGKEHNDRVAESLTANAERLILPVEGKKLDGQQMRCIVTRVQNHLVLAGAGTGKTTTIVGFIKYLLGKGYACPEEILVLSFTNASAAEMSERLEKEIGRPLTALTFHKLGLDIITAVQGRVSRIFSGDMRTFVRGQLDVLMRDPHYMRQLNHYLIYGAGEEKSPFDFSTEAEYEAYLKSAPPVTLHKDPVKSRGEMDIANFLLQGGIRYEYEKEYPVDTRTAEYGQYRPDFYLPDYDLYIEYFGINRNGEVPKWFTGKGNKSPSETYREGMSWKRELHKKHGTKLIELYAYERMEGNLLDALEEKLKDEGVVFQEISPEAVWEQIAGTENQKLDRVAELFGTVITLMKSRRYSVADVRRKNRPGSNRGSIDSVLNLVDPVYTAYEAMLKREKSIDFNDMINLAADFVEAGRWRHPYRYVIIDEYQDMAQSRYRLLSALRRQKNFRLFCVGDDWQSIYRFSGSDIGFILNFEKYWGPAVTSRIETTYRFPESLIEASGSFIMKNPAQKRKSLKSPRPDTDFAVAKVSAYSDRTAADNIAGILKDLPENSSVLLLGRYRFDVRMLDENPAFAYWYSTGEKKTVVQLKDREDLSMSFLTVHGSKGLQADYVFLLNLKRRGMGFPSQIADAPVLALLLEDCDRYPFAEERRLFYVALTRAKKKVYLVALKGNESVFLEEMEKKFGKKIRNANFICPQCGGFLVRKTGKFGDFYGCSNYRTNGCRYIRKIPAAPKKENPNAGGRKSG